MNDKKVVCLCTLFPIVYINPKIYLFRDDWARFRIVSYKRGSGKPGFRLLILVWKISIEWTWPENRKDAYKGELKEEESVLNPNWYRRRHHDNDNGLMSASFDQEIIISRPVSPTRSTHWHRATYDVASSIEQPRPLPPTLCRPLQQERRCSRIQTSWLILPESPATTTTAPEPPYQGPPPPVFRQP
jgi:hypothetical protein